MHFSLFTAAAAFVIPAPVETADLTKSSQEHNAELDKRETFHIRYCRDDFGRGGCINDDIFAMRGYRECHSMDNYLNNQVTSIHIQPGFGCKFSDDSHCGMPNYVSQGDNDNVGEEWNDRISSFFCYPL